MNITGCVIVRLAHGPDHVSLRTDLPEACFPFGAMLSLNFTAARGTGEDYVRNHFPGVPVELEQSLAGLEMKFSVGKRDA